MHPFPASKPNMSKKCTFTEFNNSTEIAVLLLSLVEVVVPCSALPWTNKTLNLARRLGRSELYARQTETFIHIFYRIVSFIRIQILCKNKEPWNEISIIVLFIFVCLWRRLWVGYYDTTDKAAKQAGKPTHFTSLPCGRALELGKKI